MTFHDQRLPEEVEVGAVGGPAFRSDVVSISSGAEQRNESWAQQRAAWVLGYGIQERSGYAEMLAHFYARRGKVHSFPFKDWSDPTATNEIVATGDGSRRVFHLIRTYDAGNSDPDYVRYITRPDFASVVIKVDGVIDNDWAAGDAGTIIWDNPEVKASGLLTFTTQPANNDTVTIGVRVYTFKTTLTGAANEVARGASVAAAAVNFIAAINASSGAGSLYGTGTVAHAGVRAIYAAGNAAVTARAYGVAGNSIVTTKSSTHISWGSGTLTGGVDSIRPQAGEVVTWSGDFFVPCRYDVDAYTLTLAAGAAGEISQLNICEVRENPNTAPIDIEFVNDTSPIGENVSTVANLIVADIVVIDDGLGTNVLSVGGADQDKFVVVTDDDGPHLCLKAGTSIDVGTLNCTVTVYDPSVGANPAATAAYVLTITLVNRAPIVSLLNTTSVLPLGTSTVSHVLVADIALVTHSTGTYSLTLEGANAAEFEIVGAVGAEKLYLKAGYDTSTPAQLLVTVKASDPSVTAYSPIYTTVEYAVIVGVTPATHTYSTPGDYTLVVPAYSNLEIECDGAGTGSWGYSPGTAGAPAAATETYVQSDQTITLLHRWRVKPFTMPENPDAWTPGYVAPTAVQNSFGVGASLTLAYGGDPGGAGYAPVTTVIWSTGTAEPSTVPVVGRGLPSGRGGNHTQADGSPISGGVSVVAPASGLNALQLLMGQGNTSMTFGPSTAGYAHVTSASGNAGSAPGAGGSGGAYMYAVRPGGGYSITVTDTSLAGGGGGSFAKKTWTYGTSQIGSGSDYTAPSPVIGETLYIRVGSGGVAGAGIVSGANGGNGRCIIRVS